MRNFKGAVLAVGILLLGVAVACGGSDGDSKNLIPQRATLVGSIDFEQFLGAMTGDLEQISQLLSSESVGGQDGFGELLDPDQFRPGGLFPDVGRVEIFGEISDSEGADYFGVVLHGSFNETELIVGLESISGLDLIQGTHKGANVYAPADGGEEFMLSVLDGEIFAVGAGGALQDIIDIWAGDAEPASGPLMDVFGEFDDGIFGLAAKVPQDIAEEADLSSIPQLADLPISLDFISDLDIVGLGGDLNEGSLDLVITLDFVSQESAESLEGFVGGILTFASSLSPDPGITDLLSGLEIDRDGRRLTINIGVPTADIPELFGDLTGITGETTSGGSPPGTPEIRLLPTVIGDEIPLMPSTLHVTEGESVAYSTTPPTSGEHWPRWAECGWYPDGLPDEVTTHNLEHGNIVVSYNFTNPAQATELRQALDRVSQFEEWGVARSYDKIPDGQVALAAWGHLATFQGVSPRAIGLFFETLAGQAGPERIAC